MNLRHREQLAGNTSFFLLIFLIRTRAYRMYFESLGWRKNTSAISRRAQKHSVRCITSPISTTIESAFEAPQPSRLSLGQPPGTFPWQPVSDIDLPTQEAFAAIYGITFRTSGTDAKDILSLVQWAPPAVALQAVLLKWQSDGLYLKVSQDLILDNHYLFDVQFRTFSGGTIFQLIEEKVCSQEKLQLGRTCIEADLECHESQRQQYSNGTYPSPEFQSADAEPFWKRAYRAIEWVDAKRILLATATPKLVLESSFFVIAESFFKRYKKQLDGLKARYYPHILTSADVFLVRSKYLRLLEDLYGSMMELGLSWHKHAMSIIK